MSTGGGQRLNTVWNLVRNCRFKHGDMEDGVNTSEGVGESECEGVSASFGKNVERS